MRRPSGAATIMMQNFGAVPPPPEKWSRVCKETPMAMCINLLNFKALNCYPKSNSFQIQPGDLLIFITPTCVFNFVDRPLDVFQCNIRTAEATHEI